MQKLELLHKDAFGKSSLQAMQQKILKRIRLKTFRRFAKATFLCLCVNAELKSKRDEIKRLKKNGFYQQK